MPPERTGWFGSALAIVAALTAVRVAGLWFDRTDLFVDESQYWVWGQHLDFGYYSKPPLIAWIIRLVTDLAGSDGPFWVRLPGPFLHGATALILAALAARLSGSRAAIWTAAGYATAPFVAVGSALFSTDTAMAPFFAAALYLYFRAAREGGPGFAALAGVAIGGAFLAKYAAVYFLLGAALAAVFARSLRLSLAQAALMLAAFAVVISPNVWWNLTHDLTTVSHTMDNVGWVRAERPLAGLNAAGLAEFVASQFAVFGPVAFAALVWVLLRRKTGTERALACFVLPALLIVAAQALIDKAYANWAVSAYFAGTVLVMPRLAAGARGLAAASVALNAAVCLALPAALAVAPTLMLGRDEPLLSRYLGRADLSRAAIAAARDAGAAVVVAANRDVLADLFYTGRDAGLAFRAVPPTGAPRNYFEQMFPLDAGATGPLIAVLASPPVCDGAEVPPYRGLPVTGAYAGESIAAYLVDATCVAER